MNVARSCTTYQILFDYPFVQEYQELINTLNKANPDKKTRRKLQHFFDDFNRCLKSWLLIYMATKVSYSATYMFIRRLESMKIPQNLKNPIKNFFLKLAYGLCNF